MKLSDTSDVFFGQKTDSLKTENGKQKTEKPKASKELSFSDDVASLAKQTGLLRRKELSTTKQNEFQEV